MLYAIAVLGKGRDAIRCDYATLPVQWAGKLRLTGLGRERLYDRLIYRIKKMYFIETNLYLKG